MDNHDNFSFKNLTTKTTRLLWNTRFGGGFCAYYYRNILIYFLSEIKECYDDLKIHIYNTKSARIKSSFLSIWYT